MRKDLDYYQKIDLGNQTQNWSNDFERRNSELFKDLLSAFIFQSESKSFTSMFVTKVLGEPNFKNYEKSTEVWIYEWEDLHGGLTNYESSTPLAFKDGKLLGFYETEEKGRA